MNRKALWLAPLPALVLAACAGERGSPRTATMRDSAGIRIVENTAGSWSDSAQWRLSRAPEVSIGVAEGEPEYQLYRVRGAMRLDDGRIVIANGGTYELRFYDAAGRYLASVGRKGDGPGEFRTLSSISRFAGDSLMVFDWRRRVSIFDEVGRFIRAFPVPLIGERVVPQPVGPFANGALLAVDASADRPAGITTGVIDDSMAVFRLGPNGALRDTLGRFPGVQRFVGPEGRGYYTEALPFGRSPSLAISGDHFFFGSGETYEIAVYSQAGELERLIRRAHQNLAVTPAIIAEMQDEALRESKGIRRDWNERMFSQMPFPDFMPAYASLRVDAAGDLWVEEYRPPGDDQPRWTIFDPAGRMLGMIDTPPGFAIYQIGDDFVLGIWKDDVGIEYVQLYRLIKNAN